MISDDILEKLLFIVESAKVRRWHNKPSIPVQTTGEHSFNMLLCLIVLHPAPSADLMEAIIRHDIAERISGDFSHDMKKQYPVLKEIDNEIAESFQQELGLRPLNLTDADKLWLKLLDQLEVLTYLELCVESNDETQDIYENCSNIVADCMSALQHYGFFLENESAGAVH